MDILLLGLLFGIALVDSVNPSALLATGYLLKKAPEPQKTASVLAYVAGIFCFYFAIGVALLLGASFILEAFAPIVESTVAYVLQALVGVALFIWSWIPPKPPEKSRFHPKVFKFSTLFILGVTVTLVEFTTALPYLGAIAILQGLSLHFMLNLTILFVYNIIFILPPLGLLLFYRKNHQRFAEWQARRLKKQDGKPDTTMQWIAGAVGVLLFLDALSRLGMTNITIGG